MPRRFVRTLHYGLLVAALMLTAGCDRLRDDPAPAEPTLAPMLARSVVRAEARVVPSQWATLSTPAGGRVATLDVTEGEAVREGDLLLTFEATDQVARVAQARADLKAAEAAFAQVVAGASAEEIAAAEAAVEAAQAQAFAAGGSLGGSRAALDRVEAGATAEELAIAQKRIDQAQNQLWGAQNQRDGICGRVGDPGVAQSECDGAEAAVGVAFEAIQIAKLELDRLKVGAPVEDRSAARSQVQQTAGGLASAQALARQAEAQLALLRRGATAEDIAQADAGVMQAQAAYDQTRAALNDTELRAPFDGTVARLLVQLGERIAPGAPAVQFGDLAQFVVETDDLTELSVVRIEVGSSAVLRFDALEDLEITGKVARIEPLGQDKLGDIIFTVVIEPDRQDPRLRWNMTATVEIEPTD